MTVMARGSKGQLVMDYEATYATSPSPAGIGPMPFSSFTLVPKQDVTQSKVITGSMNPTEPILGNINVSGAANVPLDTVVFGAWLRAMFGVASSVVTGSKTAAAVTCANATETFTLSTHGLSDGQGITVAGTALPTGLAAGTVYYLRDKDTNTFKLCATPGGAVVTFTSDGTDVTITTVCAHVWKSGADMPSLVLEMGHPDMTTPEYFLHNGVKIAKLGMEFMPAGELSANLDLIGAKTTASTTAYDATLTTPGTLDLLNNFQAALQEGGSALARGTRVSMDVSFDLDDTVYCIGDLGQRAALPQGITGISGQITTTFEDMTQLTKALNNTESSLRIRLTKGANYLEFLLPEVKYGINGVPVEGPRGLLVTLDYNAYYANANEAAAMQVTLLNTRNTAY